MQSTAKLFSVVFCSASKNTMVFSCQYCVDMTLPIVKLKVGDWCVQFPHCNR